MCEPTCGQEIKVSLYESKMDNYSISYSDIFGSTVKLSEVDIESLMRKRFVFRPLPLLRSAFRLSRGVTRDGFGYKEVLIFENMNRDSINSFRRFKELMDSKSLGSVSVEMLGYDVARGWFVTEMLDLTLHQLLRTSSHNVTWTRSETTGPCDGIEVMRSLCAFLSVFKALQLYFPNLLDFVFFTRYNRVKFLCFQACESEVLNPQKINGLSIPRKNNLLEVCSIMEVLTGKIPFDTLMYDGLCRRIPADELNAPHLPSQATSQANLIPLVVQNMYSHIRSFSYHYNVERYFDFPLFQPWMLSMGMLNNFWLLAHNHDTSILDDFAIIYNQKPKLCVSISRWPEVQGDVIAEFMKKRENKYQRSRQQAKQFGPLPDYMLAEFGNSIHRHASKDLIYIQAVNGVPAQLAFASALAPRQAAPAPAPALIQHVALQIPSLYVPPPSNPMHHLAIENLLLERMDLSGQLHRMICEHEYGSVERINMYSTLVYAWKRFGL